jgi:DNA-binding transcriptional LysR family regulator
LDWIVSFVSVAHEGGFSAAAKAQLRSQPRISTHISAFERVLGARLFDRSVHPATLTPEGRALLPHAEEVLSRLDVFSDVASEDCGTARGEVRVGLYPSAAAYLYPLLAQQLRRESPAVTAVLREGDTLALETMLMAGEVDLAVRPVLPLVRGGMLAHQRLWSEPLVAVVPDGHQLAGATSVRLKRLADFPLVTIGVQTDGLRQFEANLAFAEAGLRPRIAFQTNQPQTLAALVRAGLGVGVTNALAMVTANCAGVELVPIAASTVDRAVAVWWHADRQRSAATTLVREMIASLPPPQLPNVDVAGANGGAVSIGADLVPGNTSPRSSEVMANCSEP